MRELLLINNEPTPEDRGRIVRAGELGLTDPLYNIDALAAKLAAFGAVTVRHYTQLRTLDSAPDAIFLSGCFTDWDREHHRGQLSTVPEGFRLLASRENCRVQMLAHESRPIFGTQFHPELQNDAHRDGQRILENFFAHYVK